MTDGSVMAMNSERRERSYNGELMAKAIPVEELFKKTMESMGKKVESHTKNKNEKIDFIVNGKSIDIKNDTNFGKTGNLFLEWEYLFFKTKTIHRCWGHPECKNPKAKYLAFYKKSTNEFWIYNEEKYLNGFWKACEDKRIRLHIEHTDNIKSTIGFIFPDGYVKPDLVRTAYNEESKQMEDLNGGLDKYWDETFK